MGGRYGEHVDCWARYRLMRPGAARGYPALSGVIDPRDYLSDTNQASLSFTDHGLPLYPTCPAIGQQLLPKGADAWRTYSVERPYDHIDRAIRALLKESNAHGQDESITQRTVHTNSSNDESCPTLSSF